MTSSRISLCSRLDTSGCTHHGGASVDCIRRVSRTLDIFHESTGPFTGLSVEHIIATKDLRLTGEPAEHPIGIPSREKNQHAACQTLHQEKIQRMWGKRFSGHNSKRFSGRGKPKPKDMYKLQKGSVANVCKSKEKSMTPCSILEENQTTQIQCPLSFCLLPNMRNGRVA